MTSLLYQPAIRLEFADIAFIADHKECSPLSVKYDAGRFVKYHLADILCLL